ncbi:cytochrome P450 720B2-like [Cryptomeria japonica]|uniref:cytochrome P450 720B2-like n=1 Tax=Cryptomeria japonica TaxID=3369 RepID=UPI0027DA8765|nr:cytochrome P450 720B2-like [Cryptomeria japonica]
MEQHMGFAVILTCILSVIVLLVLGRQVIWRTDNKKKRLPPGSIGWPIIGESISFFRSINSPYQENRRKFTDEHESRYGPIFRCSLFGKPKTIVSVDPEFSKYVLQNEGRFFQAKYPSSTVKLIGKYGLLDVHGELQRKLHGTAVNLLKHENLESDFMEDIQHVFITGMKKWEKQRDIPIQHKCHQLVLNLMGKKLLDLPPAEELEDIYKAFDEYIGAVLCLPLNIPGTAFARGFKARKTLIKKIYECIEDRRQHPEVNHNDLLTKLLREGIYSDEIIADLILFLLFAGFETSSTTMAFAVKFLTENPQALKEITEEHDAILKSKGKDDQTLTWDDYMSMKFTQCVIKETLRMVSAAPCVFREPKEDIEYKDFLIPKGWIVFVFLSGQHLDEKYHFEAHKFNPWRWQNEGHEISQNPWYMPFGKGGRLCPGYHLARFEIALFLHNLVTKFRWEPLEASSAIYFPLPSMAKGYPIRLHSRLQE